MNQVSSYQERHIVNNINWTVKRRILATNRSQRFRKSTILSLITGENAKGYGQDLFLFGIKKEAVKVFGI
jgi:molybdate transport system ATP-binding protein